MAAAGTSLAGTATAAGWANVAATAMVTSAASGAAISTINNKGNLGAVIKDVTSTESLKNYVVAGVSAGLAGESIGVRLAVNSALQTVVHGGKFKDNLTQAAISLAADALSGAIYQKVGDSLVGSGLPTKVAVHAIVGGLIGEAAGGDFTTAALAAGANKALIQMVGDQIFPGVAHDQVLAMTSQLLGMTVAAAAGGSETDQRVAGWVAQQGTVYNYLDHGQKETLANQLDAECKGNSQCIHDKLDQWKPVADKQNSFTPAEQAQYDQAQAILTGKLESNCQSDFCKAYTQIEMKLAGLNCADVSCLRESAGAIQKAQYLNQGQWGKLLLDAVGDGGAIAGALVPVLTGGAKAVAGAGAAVDDAVVVGAKNAGELAEVGASTKGSTGTPVWSSSEGVYSGSLPGGYPPGTTTVNGKVVENAGDFSNGVLGAKGAGEIAGSAKNFSIADRVFGQLNDPRMGQLAGKLDADALQKLANNPSATRFMDARTGHINVIQEVEGKLIRITVPRDEMKIISVGPIRPNQVKNLLGKGDFVPLP
ncbi:DUF637 domain-containing protein [Pseudomonas sp. NPDC089534]|uniref:DUF637 domain-containing protein n=1 Tax=Pseudomonas sp. NPDC089534 TaxID=3364468 RepID=UPI00381EA7D5